MGGADFPQRRIQTFIPANGKPSVNKVKNECFITECFNGSEYNVDHIYRKELKKNCRFCEFNQTNIVMQE